MQKLLYILFYITLISCNSKKEEIKEEVIVFSDNGTTIYESDIYEVINVFYEVYLSRISKKEYLKDNAAVYLLFNSQPDDFELVDNKLLEKIVGDSLIEEKDIEFIHRQIKNSKEITLDKSRISDFKLTDKETLSKLLFSEENQTKNERDIFDYDIASIYLPLFTINKNKVLVYGYSFIFGGSCISIYEKENEKWIWVKTFVSE